MKRHLLLIAATVALVFTAWVPATAGPPVRSTDAFPFTGPDFEHDLVIFVNTSRETFCTEAQAAFEQAVADWLEGGMQGPFPDDPDPAPLGDVAIPFQFVETPNGAIATTMGPVEGLHMELWVLDDPADRVGVGACLDTDDANELFGSGTGTFRGGNTDLFGAFFGGDVARPWFIDHTEGGGVVTTPAGDRYDYSWFFHQHIPCADGPGPRCEVAKFSLRPLS